MDDTEAFMRNSANSVARWLRPSLRETKLYQATAATVICLVLTGIRFLRQGSAPQEEHNASFSWWPAQRLKYRVPGTHVNSNLGAPDRRKHIWHGAKDKPAQTSTQRWM